MLLSSSTSCSVGGGEERTTATTTNNDDTTFPSSSYDIGAVDHRHDEDEEEENDDDDNEDEERDDGEAARVTESDGTMIDLRDVEECMAAATRQRCRLLSEFTTQRRRRIDIVDERACITSTNVVTKSSPLLLPPRSVNLDGPASLLGLSPSSITHGSFDSDSSTSSVSAGTTTTTIAQSQSADSSSSSSGRSRGAGCTTSCGNSPSHRSNYSSHATAIGDGSSSNSRGELSMPTKMQCSNRHTHRTLVHTPNHIIIDESCASSIDWPSSSSSSSTAILDDEEEVESSSAFQRDDDDESLSPTKNKSRKDGEEKSSEKLQDEEVTTIHLSTTWEEQNTTNTSNNDDTTTTTNQGFIGLVIVNDDDDDNDDDNVDLRKVLASTKAELVQLRREMDNFKVERDEARTERDAAQSERDVANGMLAKLYPCMDQCADVSHDLLIDNERLHEKVKENKILKIHIETLVSARETDIRALTGHVTSLQNEVSIMSEIRRADTLVIEQLVSDKKTLEHALLQTEYQLEELTKQVVYDKAIYEEVNRAVGQELNSKDTVEANLLAERNKLTEQLLIKEKYASEQKLEQERLKDTITALTRQLNDKCTSEAEELRTIKEERAELMKHIDTLHSNVMQLSTTKEEELKTKEMLIIKLFTEMDELTASITTLTNERDEYSNQIEILQCDMSRLDESNKTQLTDREKLTENIATLAEQLSTKKRIISKLKRELAGLAAFSETAVQNITAELNTSKALVNEQGLQITSLEVERDGLVKQVEVLQQSSSECLVVVEDLQTQLDKKDIVVEELRSQLLLHTESVNIPKEEEEKCGAVVEQLTLIGNELTSLSMERDNLLADNTALKRTVESYMAQNGVLKQQVHTFQVTTEMQSLKESDARSRVEDEKNKVLIANANMSKQIDELALAVKAKDDIEIKLQENLNYSNAELSKQLNAKEVIERKLLAERAEHTASNTILRSRACNTDIIGDELAMEIFKLTDSNATLEGERDELVQQLKTYHSKIETDEKSIIALTTQLEHMKKIEEEMNVDLQTTKANASQERMQLNATINSLEAKLLQSKVEEERLGNDMISLMNSHTNALTRVGTVNDRIATLESELLESRKHSNNLRVDLDTLQRSLDDAMEKNQELTVKAVQLQIGAQSRERTESQTNTDREVYLNLDTLARLGVDKDELNLAVQNDEMRERIAELEKKVNLGDTHCSESEVNHAIAALTEKLTAKEEIEAELLAEREKLTTSITRLSGHYKDMFDAKLQTEREKLTSTITNLKRDRDRLVMQIKSLHSNVSKLTADNEAELRDKKIIEDELIAEQMTLNVTITSLTDQVKAIEEIKTELLHEQVHLNNSITMMKTQLDAKEAERRSEQENFVESIKVYEERLSVKEQVETKLIAEREKLDGERNGLVKQVETLQSNIDVKVVEIQAYQRKIETDEKSIIALTTQLKHMKKTEEDMDVELQSIKAVASQEKMQLNATIKSLEARLLQSKVEQERLGNDMISLMNSHTDALTHLGVANDSIATLESELLESRKHSDKLRVDLETLEKSLDDAMEKNQEFADEKVNLDSDLAESRRCADNLGAELDLVRKSLQETTTRINDLVNEREAVRAETLAIISSDEHGNQVGFEIEQNDDFSRSNDTSSGINMPICATSFEINSNLSLLQVMRGIKLSFHSLQRDKTELHKLLTNITATIDNLQAIIQEMSARNELLSTEIATASERGIKLTTELDDVKMAASLADLISSANEKSLEASFIRSAQEVELLENEISSLESNHAVTLARLGREKNDAIDDMSQQIEILAKYHRETLALLETDRNRLIGITQDMTQEIEILTKQTEICKKELDESRLLYSDEVERHNNINLMQVSNINELQQNIECLRNDLHRVQNDLNEVTLQRDQVLTQHENIQKSLTTVLSEANCLEEKLSSKVLTLEAALETKEEEWVSLRREFESMQKSLDDTVSQRDLLQTKIEQDQLLLTNAKCEARQLDEEHNTKILILGTELIQAKQEKERLRGVIQSMEHSHAEEMTRSQDVKVELQRRHDLLTEKSACEQGRQESMIQSMEADLVEAKQQQERLDDVIRALELIHAEEMTRVRENKADLQCRFDSLTEVLSAEREEHKSKIVSLETEVLRALKEVDTLEAGVKLLECDQAELIEKSTAEQELQRSKIIALEEELSKAKNDRERLGGIVKSLEHKHSEALARISDDKIDHQHQLHASSSKIQSLETDLLQAVKEVERLEKAAKLLECNNAEAVAKLDELDDDNQDLKRQLIELTETSATEQERLRAEHLQSLRAAEGLILESLHYQEELDHAQEEIDTHKEKMLALELIANGRSDEIQCLLQKVEDNQAVTNNMDSRLRQQCGEIVELTKRVDNGRSENEKLTKSLAEEKLQNNVLNQLFADLEDEKDAMLIRIEDLSERLRSTSTTLTDVQQLMIDARQEADEFRCKLDSSEALVATLTSQNETAKAKLQSMEDECNNYTKCIADLNTKRNEESHRLLQRCKRQQEASQCEIACLENIVESMKKEYEEFKEEANSASAAQTRLFEDALDSPAREQNGLMEWIHLLEKELVDIRGKLESVTEQLNVALEERSSMENTMLTLTREYDLVLADRSSMENTISVLTKEYELFSLLARHNLEEAQNDNSILEERARILSSEAMKYKMQNRGMLQALDELTVDISDDYDDDDYKENATNFTSALTPKSLEIRRTAQMLLSSPKYEMAAGRLDSTSNYTPRSSVLQNRRIFFG